MSGRSSVFVVALLALSLLPACRIGSGFDTAEKRRNLNWDDTPLQAASATPETKPDSTATPEQQAVARLSAPIVYLLVAG
ncbi:MAG: hypothetical protein IPK87_01245 [Planctomycetes bacterium]|nr:hypothetical protein [Planctomycetota bacterium]